MKLKLSVQWIKFFLLDDISLINDDVGTKTAANKRNYQIILSFPEDLRAS